MIRQQFYVENYWKVIVYYLSDYNFSDIIINDFHDIFALDEDIKEIFSYLSSGKAKAVTYSNYELHVSIVVLGVHRYKEDFVNSIVHEAEHVKQAMLKVYKIEDKDEPPAYTVGYLVMMMYRVFKTLLCKS